jgi:MoaA/NifB/PqqE/SkfB family radical SAM enzyme
VESESRMIRGGATDRGYCSFKSLPEKDGRGVLRLVLDEGGPAFCQFAVTPICNARCGFCGFSRDVFRGDHEGHVDLERAIDAIDILYRNGVRYLVLTGGEPLMHPRLTTMVERASMLDMEIMVVTNGSLLSEKKVLELAEAGVAGLVISVDAANAEVHEENRGLPGVCEKIRLANVLAGKLKITSTASVTISKLVDFDLLPAFLNSLGFHRVTFSYPLQWLGSSFRGYSETGSIRFSEDELLSAFDRVIHMKKHFTVLNPTKSLEEMKRFVRGEPQRFPCLGGYRYFHLDWRLDLWRCHYWKTPICSIYDFDAGSRLSDGCTKCMIDCFRDSSAMHFVGVSIHDAWRAMAKRDFSAAARAVFRRANIDSIHAVIEEFHWIARSLMRLRGDSPFRRKKSISNRNPREKSRTPDALSKIRKFFSTTG